MIPGNTQEFLYQLVLELIKIIDVYIFTGEVFILFSQLSNIADGMKI